MTLLHQLVLVVALAALVGWGWRLSRRHTAGTTEALLAAAALAAGFAVIWTLALGRVGLSGSTVCLAAGPVAAWAADRLIQLRRTGGSAGGTSGRPAAGAWWWTNVSTLDRILLGAAAGLLAGAVLEVALQPGFGVDAVEYHLPIALGWLHNGHAGSVQSITYDFPVGYYPLTTEVLLSWLLGLSRSFAPMAAVGPVTAAIGALGLWRLLECLGIARPQRWLAVVAFLTLPTTLFGVNTTGPGTDLSAVSWLLCGAALAAGATRPATASRSAGASQPHRAILLAPALLAFGLGIGTKTTVAPLAIVVLVVVLWRCRAELRSASLRTLGLPLAAGVVAALVVGVPWYLRNWLVHGWPLWPFSAGPVGDRLPHTMALFSTSFLSRPRVTFDATPRLYLENLGGGVALMAGMLLAPLAARRRSVLAVSGVALLALLAWGLAPFTGLAPNPLLDGLAITTVRYILSALVACLVAVSLLARPDSAAWLRRGAAAVTVAAIGWSLWADVRLGYPQIPRPAWPLALAVAGALLSWAAPRLRPAIATPLRLTAGLATAALLVVLATLAAPGWLAREARDQDGNAPVTAFMLAQPGYARSEAPVAFAPAELATLAGPRLTHPLSLIPPEESCRRTLDRLDRGWIVLRPHLQAPGILTSFRSPTCLRHVRPVYDDGTTVVYAPRSEASG